MKYSQHVFRHAMDSPDVITAICKRCKKEAPCLTNETTAAEFQETFMCELCIQQVFQEYRQRILEQMTEEKRASNKTKK